MKLKCYEYFYGRRVARKLFFTELPKHSYLFIYLINHSLLILAIYDFTILFIYFLGSRSKGGEERWSEECEINNATHIFWTEELFFWRFEKRKIKSKLAFVFFHFVRFRFFFLLLLSIE